MKIVNIHEAKTHFSKLLDQVAAGDEIVIARAGKPIARLVPTSSESGKPVFGTERGRFVVPDDFDAPMPKSLLKMFYG